MSHYNLAARWIESDAYEEAHADIRALNDRLPQVAVVSFAQEVLRRLAEREKESSDGGETGIAPQLTRLAEALMADDGAEAIRCIEKIRLKGVSIETLYLSYLAGAARLLGTWWDESRVSFVDVTVGTSRIYSIMRSMRHLFVSDEPIATKSAAFVAVPGEFHTLGVTMAADIFRNEGWDIDLKVGRTHEELVRELGRSSPRIIGLSCAGEHSSIALARLIVAVRVSCPHAYIVISGHVLEDTRDIASALGADAIAEDVDAARMVLNGLWQRINSLPR